MKKILSNKLVKSSVVYTIINFISKIFPFLLLPLLTRELTLSDYGVYALIRSLTGIMTPIVGFNVSEAIIRNYFSFDGRHFSKYIASGTLITLISCIGLSVLAFLFSNTELYQHFDLTFKYVLIAILISFFTSLNNIERGLLRNEGNNKLFAILVLSQTVFFFVAIFILFWCRILTLNNILLIELISFAGFGFISLILLIKKYKIKFAFDFIDISDILKYAAPLVINSLLAYLFALSDRFIISSKLDNSSVALYSATFQVVSILQILAVSFNAAWVPHVYRLLQDTKNGVKIFNRQKYYPMLIFLLGSIIYYFFLKFFLVKILGDKYEGSEDLLIWMLLSTLLQSLYWIVSPILQFYKKNWMLVIASLPAFIFSVTMNSYFLGDYGIVFAAMINSFAWVIIFIITYINSNLQIKRHDQSTLSGL